MESREKFPSAEDIPHRVEISDEDILEAMKSIKGFLDITFDDFKELYRIAYTHAVERITKTVTAKDIMTESVHAVKKDALLAEVAELMALKGVAGVPVIEDGGRVVGVISEKDFLSLMGRGARSFMGVVADCLKGRECLVAEVKGRLAKDIMSSPAITVGPDASLREIIGIFMTKRINRVPVVDADGMLKGIVSRADVIQALRGK